MFVAKKTRRIFGSIKWCIVCAPKPDLTTGTSRQRNRTKPPRNLVLGLKKWIGQVRCENKTELRKHKVLHCMHPKTRYNNVYLPATESRETTQKHCFRPKEVDWACSLRKNKTQLRKHKVVHCMHPKTRSHNGYLQATESRETTQNLVLGRNKWIGQDLSEKTRRN